MAGEDVTNLFFDPALQAQASRSLMPMMQMERASRMAMQGGGMNEAAPRAPMMRPPAPRVSGRSAGSRAGGGSPTGYEDFSNSGQLQSLLAQYGLAPAQAQPNVLLPNSGFFGDHPNLSRGLENAAIAVAHTPESTTTGGAISAIAQGALSIPQYRNQVQTQRQMAPLAMAGAMQSLQKGQLDNQLLAAHAKYYGAEADAIPGKLEMQRTIQQAKEEYQSQSLDIRQQAEDRMTGQNNIINDLRQKNQENNERYRDLQGKMNEARTLANPHVGALAQVGWDPNSGEAPTAQHYKKAAQLTQQNAMALASAKAAAGGEESDRRALRNARLGVLRKSIADNQDLLKKANENKANGPLLEWFFKNRGSLPEVKSISDPRIAQKFNEYKVGLQKQIDDATNEAFSPEKP